jgi:hypothetical protein
VSAANPVTKPLESSPTQHYDSIDNPLPKSQILINSEEEATDMDMTRRRAVAVLAGLSTCGLSGCLNTSSGSASGRNPEYGYINQRPVYISENINLQFPPEMNRVSDTGDADVIVLSPDTRASVAQIVNWLKTQKAVSVFGEANKAVETWTVWRESDLYQELESKGRDGRTQVPADSKEIISRWKTETTVASHVSTLDSNPDGNKIAERIDFTFQLMDEDGGLSSDAAESKPDSTN